MVIWPAVPLMRPPMPASELFLIVSDPVLSALMVKAAEAPT